LKNGGKSKIMAKKRTHKTTKNTAPRPPVTKLAEYTLDVNGVFTIITDIVDEKVFDKLYREWFDHPTTKMWCGSSLVEYIKRKSPKNICLLREDFLKTIEGKVVIPATKEEFEAENN
jgi:hypothetical protein